MGEYEEEEEDGVTVAVASPPFCRGVAVAVVRFLAPPARSPQALDPALGHGSERLRVVAIAPADRECDGVVPDIPRDQYDVPREGGHLSQRLVQRISGAL